MERHRMVPLCVWVLYAFVGSLSEGLQFVTEPTSGVAVLQRPFSFDCQAEDPSPVTYLWRFGEQDIAAGAGGSVLLTKRVVYPNGTLLIRDVSQEDVGIYMCIATASGKSIYSEKVTLRLAYIATTFTVSPSNQTVKLGDDVAFYCDIDSLPSAIYSWRLNEQDLNIFTVTTGQGTQQTSLSISSVGYPDGGEYVCVATNTLLGVKRFSYAGRLTVLGKPQMVLPPTNVTIPSGYDAVFNCSAIANPPPQLTWYKGSQQEQLEEIKATERVEILQNGSLVIREAASADAFGYTCVVLNEYGETRATAYLSFAGIPLAPVLTVTPQNQTMPEGSDVTLVCIAEGNPDPRIRWAKDGAPLPVSNQNMSQLVIVNITSEDGGLYTCIASNPEGQSEASAYVTVLFSPVFIARPQSTTVLEGSDVTLPCHAKGYPAPEIQWISPASVILPVSSSADNVVVDANGTLVLPNITTSNQGRYTCYAHNSLGSVNAVVFITVESPPHFTSQPKSRMVHSGDETTLSCHASGYPRPTVTWYRQGQEHQLHQNARLVIAPDGDLTLRSVLSGDEGVYRCVAENVHGRVEAAATLTVLVPPTFTVAPSSVSAAPGQTIRLRCEVLGVPVPSLRWLRDGDTLVLKNNMFIDPDFTLIIKNISRDQFGHYTCLGENLAGQRAVTAAVYLSGQPYFTTQPLNTTVNVTVPLTLSCRADHSLANATKTPTISWYKGLRGQGSSLLVAYIDALDDRNVEKKSHVRSTREGDIVFEGVQKVDEGWYYCIAFNEEGRTFSEPIYINVQVPPKIQTVSISSSLVPTKVTLTCVAIGNPDPKFTWGSPSHREITNNTDDYRIEKGTLEITNATNTRDGGSWTCEACNVLGCAADSVVLSVEGKPLIYNVAAARNDSTVHISCRAVGLPVPNITYAAHDGRDSHTLPGHSVVNGELYINRVFVQDGYNCSAENIHGKDSVMLTRPHQPRLTRASATSRNITLELDVRGAVGVLPLDGVTVEHRSQDQNNWTSVFILLPPPEKVRSRFSWELVLNAEHLATSSGSDQSEVTSGSISGEVNSLSRETNQENSSQGNEDNLSQRMSLLNEEASLGGNDHVEVVVTGLVPYTVYVARARLENVLGAGPVSQNTIQIMTDADAPEPPYNVHVTTEGRDLNVTWISPVHLHGNKEDILFSVLLIDPEGNVVSNTTVFPSQPMIVQYADLEPRNYTVVLATVNSALHLSSDLVTINTTVKENAPVFIPSIVTAIALSDSTISVQWQVPEDTSTVKPQVEGYVVRVLSESLSFPREFVVNSSLSSSLNVSNLTERTDYHLSVAAYNRGGTGAFSETVTVKTHFSPFSLSAYENHNLVMPGEAVAVIGGCVGGVLFVLLMLLFIYQCRKNYHGNSLNLLQPSHGLDPLYMENPKGLYQTGRWKGVRWLRSFRAYQVFGAGDGGGGCGSGGREHDDDCLTGVAGLDVAVVAVSTTSRDDVKLEDARPRQSKLSLLGRSFKNWRSSVLRALPRNRQRRLTILHPHFSGAGAVPTEGSAASLRPTSSGIADFPARFAYIRQPPSGGAMGNPERSRIPGNHGRILKRQFSVQSYVNETFGDGISLSSLPDPWSNEPQEAISESSCPAPELPTASKWRVLKSALKKSRHGLASSTAGKQQDQTENGTENPASEGQTPRKTRTVHFRFPPTEQNSDTKQEPILSDNKRSTESQSGEHKPGIHDSPRPVTVTDGESVYHVLQQLDLDLERYAPAETDGQDEENPGSDRYSEWDTHHEPEASYSLPSARSQDFEHARKGLLWGTEGETGNARRLPWYFSEPKRPENDDSPSVNPEPNFGSDYGSTHDENPYISAHTDNNGRRELWQPRPLSLKLGPPSSVWCRRDTAPPNNEIAKHVRRGITPSSNDEGVMPLRSLFDDSFDDEDKTSTSGFQVENDSYDINPLDAKFLNSPGEILPLYTPTYNTTKDIFIPRRRNSDILTRPVHLLDNPRRKSFVRRLSHSSLGNFSHSSDAYVIEELSGRLVSQKPRQFVVHRAREHSPVLQNAHRSAENLVLADWPYQPRFKSEQGRPGSQSPRGQRLRVQSGLLGTHVREKPSSDNSHTPVVYSYSTQRHAGFPYISNPLLSRPSEDTGERLVADSGTVFKPQPASYGRRLGFEDSTNSRGQYEDVLFGSNTVGSETASIY